MEPIESFFDLADRKNPFQGWNIYPTGMSVCSSPTASQFRPEIKIEELAPTLDSSTMYVSWQAWKRYQYPTLIRISPLTGREIGSFQPQLPTTNIEPFMGRFHTGSLTGLIQGAHITFFALGGSETAGPLPDSQVEMKSLVSGMIAEKPLVRSTGFCFRAEQIAKRRAVNPPGNIEDWAKKLSDSIADETD